MSGNDIATCISGLNLAAKKNVFYIPALKLVYGCRVNSLVWILLVRVSISVYTGFIRLHMNPLLLFPSQMASWMVFRHMLVFRQDDSADGSQLRRCVQFVLFFGDVRKKDFVPTPTAAMFWL